MARKRRSPKLRTAPKARVLAQAVRENGPKSEAVYSLTTLLAMQAAPSAANRVRLARGWQNSRVQSALARKIAPAARKNRKAREKARIAAKHTPKVFYGDAHIRWLLPRSLAVVALWPDRPVMWREVRESLSGFSVKSVRVGRDIAMARGWLEVAEQRFQDRTLAPMTPALRWDHWTYRLTEEGRAARAFLIWAAARRMLGWPLPMVGSDGEFVRHWLRGEPVEVPRKVRTWSEGSGRWGYLPGQGPDAEWPDAGKFALEGD